MVRFAPLLAIVLSLVFAPSALAAACDGLTPTIVGTAGADTIVGTAGNDVIDGLGGNDTITGGGGVDVICGGDGNDSITANSTSGDVLVGGAGDDALNGGSGSDYVKYYDALVGVTVNLATGSAIGHGTDTLVNVEYVYGSPFNDTLTGNSGSNHLHGLAGDDRLDGAGGSDLLFGYAGDDAFIGGSGTDEAEFSRSTAGVNANLSTGVATGEGSDTLSGIENLDGSPYADTLTGNAGANELEGLGGDDTLDGGDANDSLTGGTGQNTLLGGGGTGDNVDYSEDTSGTLNVNLTTGVGTGVGTDSLSGIEDVDGSPTADTIVGDALSNRLEGGLGADSISGAGGDDLIWPDSTKGGTGANDTVDGGAGIDGIIYRYSNTAVTINIAAGTASGEGSDTFTNIEDAYGSDLADTITGDAGINYLEGNLGNDTINGAAGNDELAGDDGNDQLNGDAGDDLLFGYSGNDAYNGGDGWDTSSFDPSPAPVVVDMQAGTASGEGTDTLSSVEEIYGSELGDQLNGSDRADWIDGNGGNDTINGLPGIDVLEGGDGGNDSITSRDNLQPDQVRCGNGTDNVSSDAADLIDPDCETVDGGTSLVGLEHFWTYQVEPLGGSFSSYTNVAGGNHTVQGRPVSNPGRGLSTNVWLTYNSQDSSPTDDLLSLGGPVGPGWQMSFSDLDSGLEAGPVDGAGLEPVVLGAGGSLRMRDGDGTPHTFARIVDGNGAFTGVYDAPAGVFVYLRDRTVTGESDDGVFGARYLATRPDRVTSYFAAAATDSSPSDGRLLAMRDRDGNQLTYGYDCIEVNDATRDVIVRIVGAPCGGITATPGYVLRLRLAKITDQGGRDVSFEYFDTQSPLNTEGRVKAIVDHDGIRTELAYDNETISRLAVVTEAAGTGDERQTQFTYAATDDPATPLQDERRRLLSVRDARTNITDFEYSTPDAEGIPRISAITDRRDTALANGKKTVFAYGEDAGNALDGTTTVQDELGNTTTYQWQRGTAATAGRLLKSVDPASITHAITWTASNTVSKVEQLNPATQVVNATWTYAHDPKTGYPTSMARPGRAATVLAYTNNTQLDGYVADIATITNPRGTESADPDDHRTSFTYLAQSPYRLWKVTEPINTATGDSADLSSSEFEYNTNGDLRSVKNGRGFSTGYSDYDANGLPRKVHRPTTGDPIAAPVDTELAYDTLGRVTCADDRREASDAGAACVFAAANKVFATFSYDRFGRILERTSPWDATRRRAERYGYDANGNVTETKRDIGYTPGTSTPTSPDSATPGASTTFTYLQHDLVSEQRLAANDAAGSERLTTSEYDVAERLTRQVDPQGNATSGNANDYSTRLAYDAAGRVIERADGEGRLWCSYYDAYANLQKQSLPKALSAATTSCPSTAPTTFVEQFTYNPAHEPTIRRDVRGKETTFAYDADGNLATVTDPASQTTSYEHDPAGRVLVQTRPAIAVCATSGGAVSGSECDNTISHNPVTKNTYDANGNLAQTTAARRAESSNGDLHITKYSYDAYDRQTRVELPMQGPSGEDLYAHTRYNDLGRITETSTQTATADIDSLAGRYKTLFTHFPDGSTASKTDNPHDSLVTYTYGVNGQVNKRSEQGQDTTFDYWPDASLKRRDHPGPIALADFSYDRSGQLTKIAQGDPANGELTIVDRDDTGLPLQVQGFDNKTATYTYDRNQNVTSRAFHGKLVEFERDTATPSDLVAKLTLGPTNTADPRQLLANFAYDDLERLTSIERLRPAGTTAATTSYNYNAAGLPTRLQTARGGATCAATGATCLQDFSYRYDPAGNVRRSSEQLLKRSQTQPDAATVKLYTYDPGDRLATDKLTQLANPRRYDYDSVGRLAAVIDTVVPTNRDTYAYNDSDHPAQQASLTVQRGALSTVYENTYGDVGSGVRGNLRRTETKIGGVVQHTRTYSYDPINRLTGSTSTPLVGNNASTSYKYDVLLRRTEISSTKGTDPETTLKLLYAATDRTASAETNTDPDQPDDRWMLQDPLGRSLAELRDETTSTEPRQLLIDHLGSTTATIDQDATVQSTLSYDTYGKRDADPPLITDAERRELTRTPYQYTGKRYDPIADATHHDARNYNPTLRQWVETDQYLDPFADLGLAVDPQTRARTMYAAGNPINMVDEDGHRPISGGSTGGCAGDFTCEVYTTQKGGRPSGTRIRGSANRRPMQGPYTSSNQRAQAAVRTSSRAAVKRVRSQARSAGRAAPQQYNWGRLDGLRGGLKNVGDGISSAAYTGYWVGYQASPYAGPFKPAALGLQAGGLSIDAAEGWAEKKTVNRFEGGGCDEQLATRRAPFMGSGDGPKNGRLANVPGGELGPSLPGCRRLEGGGIAIDIR